MILLKRVQGLGLFKLSTMKTGSWRSVYCQFLRSSQR